MKHLLSLATGIVLFLGTGSSLFAQLSPANYDDFDARFMHIGAFHNAQLQNAVSSFPIPTKPIDYETGMNELSSFERDFSMRMQYYYTHEMPDAAKTDAVFNETRLFGDERQFVKHLMDPNDILSLEQCAGNVMKLPISDENKSLVSAIVRIVSTQLTGAVTDVPLESQLAALADRWMKTNANATTAGAEIPGCMLAIGLKSCEWWRQHPDAGLLLNTSLDGKTSHAMTITNYKTADWPLVDLAGAVVAAAVNASSQLIRTGKINVQEMIVSAGTGAVSASVGVVGRIAHWIEELL